MSDLNIVNGKVFIGEELVETGLSIKNGKISRICKVSSLPKAENTIDATGLIILPGGIDVHSHILDLNFSYRENYHTGTQAAASGGITTVLEMPLGVEGKTALDVFEMQLKGFQEKSVVDFGIIGAAGYNNINSISKLVEKGAIAFKTFMLDAPEELIELKDLAAKDDHYLLEIFSEIAKTGLISSIHAENGTIIEHRITESIEQGRIDFQAHTDSRPAISEDEACVRAMLLANQTQTKLNLVHMSSKNAFGYIRLAKKRGVDVTCEITPHHLFLTADEAKKIGPWAKSDPPLRSKEHKIAAWKALNDGTIDMVASDHSPYSFEEKEIGTKTNGIFDVGSGTPGVETMFPLLLDAVNKQLLPLKKCVEVISSNPAKRFNLYPTKGYISLNSDADLVLVDMKEEYTLKNEDMFTKQKISIFDGWKMRGKMKKTIVRGNVICDEGEFLTEKGYGRFTKPIRN